MEHTLNAFARFVLLTGLVIVSSSLSAGRVSADGLIALAFPLECTLGDNCFVQNYVDHDSGPGYRDFHCGAMTYDGHDGTDFRIPSMEIQHKGIAVLAAASGVVRRIRDGVPDVMLTSAAKGNVTGEECGNGVVIDHADGWQTQYCHMAQGSVTAVLGSKVKSGQPIGLVGLSGATEFPHLHLTVRHKGQVVDPFAPTLDLNACSDQAGPTLFDGSGQNLTYRNHVVLNYGFMDGPVHNDEVEAGHVDERVPGPDSDALVAYVRVIGLEKGDAQSFAIIGPDGEPVVSRTYDPLDKAKAQNLIYIGWKRPKEGWKQGPYAALYSISKDGSTLLNKWFFLQF